MNNNQIFLARHGLCVLAAVFVGFGCKPQGQGKVVAATPGPKAELASSETYDQEPLDDFEADSFKVSTCSYEERNKRNKCDKVKLDIKVANESTGDDLDDETLTAKGREKINLSITLKADGSKYEDAVRDSDRFKIGFRSMPEKAKGDSDGVTGSFTWTPKAASTGSLDIIVRDVGRCLVETAYSKKGKLSEDKADKCKDLDSDELFSEFEEVKTVSFTIEKSALEEQKDLAINQIEAQCKTSALTGIISGVPGLLSGDPNALIGVGATTVMSSLECKSAKEQIELEYESAKILSL